MRKQECKVGMKVKYLGENVEIFAIIENEWEPFYTVVILFNDGIVQYVNHKKLKKV